MTKSEDTVKRVLHPCEHQKNGSRVGKRSFRRAQQRALREGRALYRGRWYKAAQICFPKSNDTPTAKRQKPLQYGKKAGEERRAGRLKVFSWNAGGLSIGQLDELLAWAEQTSYDLVFVQETRWRHESTWETSSFLCLHSGENKLGNSWCGLLLLISKRVTTSPLVRWTSIIPGRVMHVRLQDKYGTMDLVNCYQHPGGSAEKLSAREQVWNRLAQVLHALPLRNRLLIAGDFNMALVPRAPWIGPAVQAPISDCEPDILGDLAELYDLCALNSWAGNNEHTCMTMHGGKSCIDAIWMRRSQADPIARKTRTTPLCPLLAIQSACTHLPLSGSIPRLWKCWEKSPASPPSVHGINVEQLNQSARVNDPSWQKFLHHAQEALASFQVLNVNELTARIRQLCCQFFPSNPSRKTPIHQDADLTKLRMSKWKLWKELQKQCGSGIHSVFFRWWLVIRIRILSRESCKQSKHLRRERLRKIYSAATEAATCNNVRALFQQVRRLAPKKQKIKMSLRDTSGFLLGPLAEGQHLCSHYRKVFQDADAPTLDHLLCDHLPFDAAMLSQQITKLPAYKAVPKHCVPSVAWKNMGMFLAQWLYQHLTQLWSHCLPIIPLEWRSSWLVLVPKPGKSGSSAEHWRPISLQESLGKATLKTIVRQAQATVLPLLTCWPQYAYLPGRGTYDAIAKVLLHCEEVRQMLRAHRNTIFERRDGIPRTECVGGLQILIDLKGAFDRAPRWLLQESLLDLPLPQSILSLLLAWHQLTPYHLEHAGCTYTIEGNVGVRQGCVAAPLLWVAFKRYWKKSLARMLGYSWVRSHITVYADDNHLAWTLKDYDDVSKAISEAALVLRSFASHGMTLNLEKTVALFVVKGKFSSGLRRRYITSVKGTKHLRLDDTLVIPLVTSHVYLGMCVSYGLLTKKTLSHRRHCARKTFMALRTWWAPSRLPLDKRIQLWKTCVWPSLCYSLAETGLGAPQCLDFRRTVYHDLRWIARSPSYWTRETNQELLSRLRLRDPLLQLALDTVRHWSKKWIQATQISSGDILQDRWLILLTPYSNHSVLLWVQFCFYFIQVNGCDWPHVDSQKFWQIISGLGLEEMKRVYDVHLNLSATSGQEEDAYRCDLCEKTFSTSRGLRVHISKIHDRPYERELEHRSKDATGSLPNNETRAMGIEGMPTCSRCKKQFADWFSFDRHISRGVCQVPMTTSSATTTSTSLVTSRTPEQRTAETPLIQQDMLLANLKDTWQHLLTHKPGFRQSLMHHCCICNQWFAKGWNLTHHGSRKHSALFRQGRLHRQEFMLQNGIAPIKWECSYCTAVFQSANIHHCPVLLQISVLICASDTDSHGAHAGDGTSSARNDVVPGLAPLSCQHRRRCSHGVGSQQEAQARRRLRAKTRPPPLIEILNRKRSLHGEANAGHVTCFDQACYPSRGQHQYLEDGNWLHDVHDQSAARTTNLSPPPGQQVERDEAPVSYGSHKPTQADSLQVVDRRAGDESREVIHGGCGITGGEIRCDQIWNLRSGRELPISEVGQRQGHSRTYRSGSSKEVRGACGSQSFERLARAECHPQIPLNKTSNPQHDSEDHSFHSRSGMEECRGAAGMELPRQILSLRGDGSDRSELEACQPPTISSGSGIEEVFGPDGQDWMSRTSPPRTQNTSCLSLSSYASLSQTSAQDREQPVRDEWLGMRLTNPSSVCYLNAGLSALGWGILNHADMLDTWEDLGEWISELQRQPNPKLVYEVGVGRRMMHDWPDLLRQHDVAELLGYLMQKLEDRRITMGSWGAQYIESGWIEYEEPLLHPLPVPIPSESDHCTLQYLIDRWSTPDDVQRHGLLRPGPCFFFVHLLRFQVMRDSVLKNRCAVTGLDAPVQVPVLQTEGGPILLRYQVFCLIQHLGATPESGHYIVFLRKENEWWIKDDARPPQTLAQLAAEHQRDAYVLCLRRV